MFELSALRNDFSLKNLISTKHIHFLNWLTTHIIENIIQNRIKTITPLMISMDLKLLI